MMTVATVKEPVLLRDVTVSVDGGSDQNTQPAHQHGGPCQEEAISLLQGEELEHEDKEGDDREDDGEDHEGLYRLDSSFTAI